jgi:hypothetical protein
VETSQRVRFTSSCLTPLSRTGDSVLAFFDREDAASSEALRFVSVIVCGQ